MPIAAFFRKTFLFLAITVSLSACAGPETPGGIYDPYEADNRQVHKLNRKLDKALLGPAAEAYGGALPPEVRIGVSNFATNLSIPGMVLNDLLQLKLEDAIHNSIRFVVNTTVGIGGVLDPATPAGVELRDTDFGETLHVWGFQEGAYVELPLLGPSTTRDAIGTAVDFVINPMNQILPPSKRYLAPAASIASRLGDRYRFGTTVESILHESADSYAQSRLLFLESRRFKLGAGSASEDDQYEGLYDDILSE